MAATFNWHISQCDHDIATGGIMVAHWRCNASETVGTGDDAVDHNSSIYGSLPLSYDADADDFISYDDVQERDVLGWVWENIDQEDIETSLQTLIDEKKNPVTGSGTPWTS
jgi:5,10-methenyltetrahydromethanopterin hydrogenase